MHHFTRKSLRALLLLTLWALLAPLAGCGGGGGGAGADGTAQNEAQRYLPLVTGNRWAYRVTSSDSLGASASFIDTFTVTGTKQVNGVDATELAETNPHNSRAKRQLYLRTGSDGIFFQGEGGTSQFPAAVYPYAIMRFPLVTGDTFTALNRSGLNYGSDADGDGIKETMSLVTTVKVVGLNESVSTEAGSFSSCLNLESVVTETVIYSKSGNQVVYTFRTNEWYAPDMGLVKKAYYASGNGWFLREDSSLAGYTVGSRRDELSSPVGVAGSPTGTASGVATAQIVATFSKEMDPFSFTTTNFLVRNSAGDLTPGTIAANGNSATFTPSTALATGSYTVWVLDTATDLTGNRLTAAFTWTFTVPLPGPTVLSVIPMASTGINVLNPVVSVIFSTDIKPSTLNASTFTLKDATGTAVAGTITYADRKAKFFPTGSMSAGVVYTATVTTGITDLDGNPLKSGYSWNFTGYSGSSGGGGGGGGTGSSPVFGSYSSVDVGSFPEAVQVADVTGDARNDVLMTTSFYFDDANDYKLFLFKQGSNGKLQTPVKYATHGAYTDPPDSMAVGDINSDGKQEVVVGNGAVGIDVFEQDGSGGLKSAVLHPTSSARFVKIADINGDGRPDVIGFSGDRLVALLQQLNGTLADPVTLASGLLPQGKSFVGFDVGDVNGDGRLDLVMTETTKNVHVVTQNSDGTFAPAVVYSLSEPTWNMIDGVAVGDVNSDGRNDVVITYGGNSPNSYIGVFLQNSSGTLDAPVILPSHDIPNAIRIADVDGDGRNDVVVQHNGWVSIGVYLQRNGSLQTEQVFTTRSDNWNNESLAVGDINGDGLADVVTADVNSGMTTIYRDGSVSFSILRQKYRFPGAAPLELPGF